MAIKRNIGITEIVMTQNLLSRWAGDWSLLQDFSMLAF